MSEEAAFANLKFQLRGKSLEEAAAFIGEAAVLYMLTEEQIEELWDCVGKYIPDPNKEYTSVDEEFIGEINTDVNGKFIDDFFKYPIYEKDGDIEKSQSKEIVEDGYYYFLRPFPVESVYVLEIYRRNDTYSDLEKTIESSESLLDDPDILNYKDKRAEIFSKKDKQGKSFNDYVEIYDELKNRWLNNFRDADEESKLITQNNTKAYGDYLIVKNDVDKNYTAAEKEAARQKYYNIAREFKNKVAALKLDIVGDYYSYYGVLLTDTENLVPNRNEKAVETAKTTYEKNYDSFTDDVNTFSNYIGTSGGLDVKNLLLASMSFKEPLRKVRRLDEKFRTSKISYDDTLGEYNTAKEKIKKFGASAKDKKFLAYKLLNRNKDNPDGYGLYRDVKDLGNGEFKITINSTFGEKVHEWFTYKVDNKVMYPKWETPDRYFISYEKLESGAPVFHISCCKSGTFSDTEDILKYYYKGNNSSPLIGDVFNSYGPDGCLSLKRYQTTFNYLVESKTYRTITTNSRGKGIDVVRYGLFDAKKPYPIKIEDTVHQITRGEYNNLTKREQLEYHKIGDPTIDVDVQQITSVMNQITPLITTLGPVAQVMGALDPIMPVLENVKQTTETVQKLLETTKGQIEKIASLPIVGVVADPLLSIIEIMTKTAGIIVQFYVENYVLIKKIRDTKEKFKKENIKQKLKEIRETLEAHYDKLKEKVSQLRKSITRKDMEDNDKKKMDIISPTTEKTKPDDGASYGAELDLKAFIPEIPKEILDKINEIKDTIKKFEELIDTIDELCNMGDEIDEAMTKISEIKALVTCTPAMEPIVESIRQAALQAAEDANKQIEDYMLEQENLEKEFRKKKDSAIAYEKGVRTIVNVPLPEIVDTETVKARAKPKVEG